MRLLSADVGAGFELQAAPPARAVLARGGERSGSDTASGRRGAAEQRAAVWALLLNVHHIATDGWSGGVVCSPS